MAKEEHYRSTFVMDDVTPSPRTDQSPPPGEFFRIRQVSGGTPEEGGQMLDCRLGRDEQTGLQQVEMIFSLNPFATRTDVAGLNTVLVTEKPIIKGSSLEPASNANNHPTNDSHIEDLSYRSLQQPFEDPEDQFPIDDELDTALSAAALSSTSPSCHLQGDDKSIGLKFERGFSEPNTAADDNASERFVSEPQRPADMTTRKADWSAFSDQSRLAAGLKRDLIGYRELIAQVVDILQLEKYSRSAIQLALFLVWMLLFLVHHCLSRCINWSPVTALALLGLGAGLVDLNAASIRGSLRCLRLRPQPHWSGEDERRYESFCTQLGFLQARFNQTMAELHGYRRDKSKLAYLSLILSLVLLAWLASIFNGLFLVYVIVGAFGLVLCES